MMQVAIVSHIHGAENWSKYHSDADIKRIEPISYIDCGCKLTYFAIYYEEMVTTEIIANLPLVKE